MFSTRVQIRLNRIPEVARAVEKAAQRAADQSARRVADKASEIAPRLSGTLAGDFVVTGEGDTRTVGNTADYFIHVETGTSKMPAKPSLGPAARMEERKLKPEAEKLIGEVTR